MEKTIFQKIIDDDLPSKKIFENSNLIAIEDVAPVAPVHLLIITKKVIPSIQQIDSQDFSLLGEIVHVAQELAQKYGVKDNYRLLTNNGSDAGQTIFHLHFHLIGGRKLGAMA